MDFSAQSIDGFTEDLASRAAVPGGGGACALVAAVGASLGAMVGNLTAGKPKYAAVEAETRACIAQAGELRKRCLQLIDADAQAFGPLAAAYGIPRDDPTRAAVMEEALRGACEVPLQIMETIAEVISMLERIAPIGSALAISDAGVGAVCCVAALQGASLNVFINTKAMENRAYAQEAENRAQALMDEYCPRAEEVYAYVENRVRG